MRSVGEATHSSIHDDSQSASSVRVVSGDKFPSLRYLQVTFGGGEGWDEISTLLRNNPCIQTLILNTRRILATKRPTFYADGDNARTHYKVSS